MVEQQTCPYCGAEKVAVRPSLIVEFSCGSENYQDGARRSRKKDCYERQIGQLQARIDEIMFEHCPDEMTKEQIERYTNAQRIVEE